MALLGTIGSKCKQKTEREFVDACALHLQLLLEYQIMIQAGIRTNFAALRNTP